MTKPEAKTKGMCIATRCTSVEQFIQMFHRFVDDESFFVSTLNTRPPGLETSFSVQLQDGTPVLRGMCVVKESWTTPSNPFKTPGVRLGIKRLTANSTAVFEQLLATKKALAKPPPPRPQLAAVVVPKTIGKRAETGPIQSAPPRPPSIPTPPVGTPRIEVPRLPTPPAGTPRVAVTRLPTPVPIEPERTDSLNEPTNVAPNRLAETQKVERPTTKPGEVKPTEVKLGEAPQLAPPEPDEDRTPGSDLVLPANPLMNLNDDALEGYVECTLYEETGNFFPAEDDLSGAPLGEVIEPPPPARNTPSPFDPPKPDVVTDHSATNLLVLPNGASSLPPIAITPPASESAPLIARGSLPAVDPPVEIALKKKGGGMWWLIAIAAVLCIGAGGFYVYTQTYMPQQASATPREKPAVEKPTPVEREKVAEVEKPVEKEKPAEKPTEATEEPPPPSRNGPVVGDGPCKLVIASTPAGSMVQVDDKVIAPSPITVATTCGPHKVDVSHARYQTITKTVTLTEDKKQSIDVNLQRPTHSVKVTSNPTGATIFINGRRAGITPTVLSVLGWETVTLEFKKTGYQPASERLYSRQVEDNVSVRLVKW